MYVVPDEKYATRSSRNLHISWIHALGTGSGRESIAECHNNCVYIGYRLLHQKVSSNSVELWTGTSTYLQKYSMNMSKKFNIPDYITD